jgi:hypothetical protein
MQKAALVKSTFFMNLITENNHIKQELHGKRLICELAFERSRFEQWTRILPKDVNVWNDYPFIAAVVTVGVGVYEYEQGDYWHAFPWLSLAGRQKWENKFTQFLENHESLESFKSFKSLRGIEYVAIILAHGGIPQYCKADFFKLMIHHADPEQSSIDFIEFLTKHPSCFQNIDKPVEKFLLHGGEAAEDLLSRFFSLWQSRERGDGGGTFGLPHRIVEAFGQWYKENGSAYRQRLRKRRFPKASLCLKPGDLDVYLYLPRCDDHPEINKNTVWKTLDRSWAVTADHEIPLPFAEKWDVEIKREKNTLTGISDALPVIFFDRETGKAIHDPKHRRLPENLWAVFLQSSKTSPSPLYSEPMRAWAGYEIAVFDLTGHKNLQIDEHEFEIRRPFFNVSEDPVIRGCKTQKGVLIFHAAPQISWEGSANLSLTKNGVNQGSIDIQAHDFKLWFDTPGEYSFHLRGPFGQNVRKHFVFIPGLDFVAEPAVWWPTTEKVRFHLSAEGFQFLSENNRPPPFFSTAPQLTFRALTKTKDFNLVAEIPTLKWRFVGADGDAEEWTNKPVEKSIQELQQIDYPRLVFELADFETTISMSMPGNQGIISPPTGSQSKVSERNTWVFDLREAWNQVIQTGHAEKFDILIRDVNERQLYQGPVLNIRPYWDITRFRAEWNKEHIEEIMISWSEQEQPVTDRWLLLVPLWRPWENEIKAHHLLDHECASYVWKFDKLRPGRYIVRAIHAPWGCENWLTAQFISQSMVDVNKESWGETFCHPHEGVGMDNYLECLLAHWYRPELVTSPPQVPMDISPDYALRFLKGVDRVDSLEKISIRGRDGSCALNIFCLNPHATTEAVSCVQDFSDLWEKILPSPQILSFEPSQQDKKFIQEIACNYTELSSMKVKRTIKQEFKQRSLSDPLKQWHKNLTKDLPPAGDVIFLCEKFGLPSKKFTSEGFYAEWKRVYELFKQPYIGREEI